MAKRSSTPAPSEAAVAPRYLSPAWMAAQAAQPRSELVFTSTSEISESRKQLTSSGRDPGDCLEAG